MNNIDVICMNFCVVVLIDLDHDILLFATTVHSSFICVEYMHEIDGKTSVIRFKNNNI